MKINNGKELQNIIIINSSADITKITKILWKFTENAQENLLIFWQQILRYQQVILYDLEKICLILIKMILTDELKILDDKIKANQAH